MIQIGPRVDRAVVEMVRGSIHCFRQDWFRGMCIHLFAIGFMILWIVIIVGGER